MLTSLLWVMVSLSVLCSKALQCYSLPYVCQPVATETWLSMWLLVQLSKSLTCCLGSDSCTCSLHTNPGVHKQLYGSLSQGLLSLSYPGIFQFPKGFLFQSSGLRFVLYLSISAIYFPSRHPYLGPSGGKRERKMQQELAYTFGTTDFPIGEGSSGF